VVRRARALGVTISIGADAHSTGGITNVAVGLGIARKGWLGPAEVLNTRDADAFLAFARARRAYAA
jgi:DNA polymerase (family 10)